MSDSRLILYTVYVNPLDYPGKVVVRRWFVAGAVAGAEADPEPLIVTDSVERARDAIENVAPGLYRMARNADDDAPILETWI